MQRAWRDVLRTLYRSDLERSYYRLRDSDIDRTHPLINKMESITVGELQGAVRFLDRNDLIEAKGEGGYRLTQKGFDVARELEQNDLQSMTNTRMAWFTFLIAIVEIASLSTLIASETELSSKVALGLMAVALTFLAVVSLFRPKLMQKVGNPQLG